MRREFKAHPLMILTIIRPFLVVLLLPVLRGILQYIQDRRITPILGIELILFGAILLISVLRWRAFRLVCDQSTVTVRDGVFFVRQAVIPITGLSSVQSEQTPLDFIFKSLTFRINTEAGGSKTTDYSFKLSRKDGNTVAALLYGEERGEKVRFSPIKVAVWSAATSSAFTGMLVGVPFLNTATRLVGVGVNEVLDQINEVSGKFQTYFPPIVNTATLILLCSFAVSFVYSFFKYINFRIFLNPDRIEVRSGLFVMERTAFKKKSINNVKIEQTFLMLLLKRYSMKVNVGGFGEAKSESQILVPSGKYKEIKEMFSDYFPFLKPEGKILKSHEGIVHQNRYFFWAEIFFAALIFLSLYTASIFDEFGRFIAFLTFVLGILLIYYTYLCRKEYKYCKVRFGDTVFARSKKGLRSCRLYCPRERVGEIKLYQYPPDRFFKTCNIKITVRSETADSITVRHLDFEDTKKEIFDCYGITE